MDGPVSTLLVGADVVIGRIVTFAMRLLALVRRATGLRLVAVSGPSMSPTLKSGDVVVVFMHGQVQAGDVVLAKFRSMPDRWVVKRAQRITDDGWLLVSDNPFVGGDSQTHGVADIHGRVVLRLRSGRPSRRNLRKPGSA
jgi:phage repressor protein C with HTH and peptisase S24 domain